MPKEARGSDCLISSFLKHFTKEIYFTDAQAQIKSKRQGRKPVNKKSDVNTHLEENNNINALVNSNNFSIFTGNTGINNGAKENDGGLATETAMQSVAIAKLNEAVDNIELKPLIKN